MNRLVVCVEVVNEIGFTGQQSTGIQTADASGDPVSGAFHCTGNGAAVRCVEVEVRGRGCIHCNDKMQQDATPVNNELIA